MYYTTMQVNTVPVLTILKNTNPTSYSMKTIHPSLNDIDACIAYAHKINPKKQPLTIEKLRSFPGCEHYSDEEAAEIIQSFEQLTAIAFEAITSGQSPCSYESQIVNLESNNQLPQITEPKSKAA